MASTSPLSTSSAMSTPAAVDSAALRSCPNCCRRMSSLKHDSHTICSQCRAVSCSVETRCSECKDWSVDAMQDHLKYQRSLARKSSSRKPAVTAASGSQPAVSSSPVGPSIPLAPAVSESSQLKDAILAVLQSLQGSLGINLDPSSIAPSTVPSGDGALELPVQTSTISTSPVVHSDNISMLHASARPYVGMCSVTAADRLAPIGPSPSPLGSSGTDQLQAHVVGPLSSSSSALSPTSLLFPLTPLLPFLLPYLPLFLPLLRGRPFPLTLLLSPLFLLRFILFLLSHSFSFSCFHSFFLGFGLFPFLFLRFPLSSSCLFLPLSSSFFFFFLWVSSSFVFLFLFPFVSSSFSFLLCFFSSPCSSSSWFPCFLFLSPGSSFFFLFFSSSYFVVCFRFLFPLRSSSPS